jgi:hypothetical protein
MGSNKDVHGLTRAARQARCSQLLTGATMTVADGTSPWAGISTQPSMVRTPPNDSSLFPPSCCVARLGYGAPRVGLVDVGGFLSWGSRVCCHAVCREGRRTRVRLIDYGWLGFVWVIDLAGRDSGRWYPIGRSVCITRLIKHVSWNRDPTVVMVKPLSTLIRVMHR